MNGKKLKLSLLCVVLLFFGSSVAAFGDWDPVDSYKMHFPQLPDPFGWDIAFCREGPPEQRLELADDWLCTKTGPVSDIHFWVSWEGDGVGAIESVMVCIYSNNPNGPSGWSEPNVLLWSRYFPAGYTVRPYGSGEQGWYYPDTGFWNRPDHYNYYQINITDINEPFIQQEGQIYWLGIHIKAVPFPECRVGWKTAVRPQFMDDAVWRPLTGGPWMELRDPMTYESLDLSFVITSKEEPNYAKPLEPHTKWSQPPIEIDPCSTVPTYCGWDEKSYNRDTETPAGPWKIVADDFRCLGSMPITSIHWWGSYFDWECTWAQGLPPIVPKAWWIGFWSNMPAGMQAPYSYPKILLHEFTVPANRVVIDKVGCDQYYGYYPYDITFQYSLDLDEAEVFWQDDYNDMTYDDTYWISIVALYDLQNPPTQYQWGWKTRPWSWMDDAVKFNLPSKPVPGQTNDPLSITPIVDPRWGESMDVSFELDTDPNYIKWEQLYTGIRNWPHYEDEMSMATIERWTEVETKWLQDPDLSPSGIDVDATMELTGDPLWPPQILADDFPCTRTGPITDISIWGSWLYDEMPMMDPMAVEFTLSIYSDNPMRPSGWSEPSALLWRMDFPAGAFMVEPAYEGPEGYYSPCVPVYNPQNHFLAWKYSFHIDPTQAFVQEGDPCEPVIYWLAVQARPIPVGTFRFGWKTSIIQWNDDAVWTIGERDPFQPWVELLHPETSISLDLAFEITTSEEHEEFVLRRMVADDWRCERRTPVTAVVWWGSYIGYGFEACSQGPFMPLPVQPDRFRLMMWTDVPAGDPCNLYGYSHPGEVIWRYDTDKYDEVLVGYDKKVQGIDVAICGAPSDPNWNYDVQAKLQATGQFNTVDIINVNSITPTLTQLQAYDAVLVYSDAVYSNSTALGDVMADYVDSGGGVVCMMFEIGYGSGPLPFPQAQMQGRWDAQGYYVIPRTQQFGPPQATLGTVYDPTHLIMQGVSSFDGGTSSYRPIPNTPIPPGATRIADWSDGSPLVVTKTISGVRRADLGFYPPSSDARSDFWNSSTNGALLMANALTWVASGSTSSNGPHEPVFRYSVRLPEERWFHQPDYNEVFWLSVQAIYDINTPNYEWGWTNHQHVFNDDAVAGYQNPTNGLWVWDELYDQTDASEDMSFMLFTDPNVCSTCANYNCDARVNFVDFADFADDWLWTGPAGGYNNSDLNCDGSVDFYDLKIFTDQWLSSCP